MGWHLIPGAKDKWTIRKAGSGKASRILYVEADALDYAKHRAREDLDFLYVHHADGRIRERIDMSKEQQ